VSIVRLNWLIKFSLPLGIGFSRDTRSSMFTLWMHGKRTINYYHRRTRHTFILSSIYIFLD